MRPTPLLRTFAIILAALALVILLGPGLIDAERMRPGLEATATAQLGRPVRIEGPIRARLLPSPTLGLERVTAGPLGVARVEIDLAALPLLGGRFVTTKITVSGGRAGPLDSIEGQVIPGDRPLVHAAARLAGRDLTLDAEAGAPEAGGARPLHATLAGAAARLVFDGTAGPSGANGRLTLDGQSAGRPLSGEATLSLSPEDLAIDALSIRLGEGRVSGSVVASLGLSPLPVDVSLRAASLDLDPAEEPAAVAAAPPLTAPAVAAPAAAPPAAKGPGAAGADLLALPAVLLDLPAPIVVNLDLGIDRLHWHGGLIRRLQINALAEGGTLSVSRAAAELPGATRIALSGLLSRTDGRPSFDGHLAADSDDPAGLRAWAFGREGGGPDTIHLDTGLRLAGRRIDLAPLTLAVDQIRAKGSLGVEQAETLGLVARLAARGVESGFDGSLDASGRPIGQVTFSGPSLAEAAQAWALSYRPAGAVPFRAEARLDADPQPQAVAISDLRLAAGESMITGRGRLVLGAHPKLSGVLDGNDLRLDPLLPSDSAVAPVAAARKAHASRSGPAARGAEHSPLPSAAPRPAVESEALPTLAADLTVTARSISWQSWRVEAVGFHLDSGPGLVRIDSLTGRVRGGALTGSARLGSGGAGTDITLTGADIGGLGLKAGGITLVAGSLDLTGRFTGLGLRPTAWMATLGGDGRAEIKGAVLEGIDLAAINARAAHLDSLGSVFGLVESGLTGGRTQVTSAKATVHADRGVLSSRDLQVNAEGGSLSGEGSVDLGKKTLDTRLAIRLADPGLPPLGLRLSGPWASPDKAVDANALQRMLVQRGLGKALAAPEGGGKAPKPIDMLRGLLRRNP